MNLLEQIEAILKGMDKDELSCDYGWWETTEGAEFGASKLQEIRTLLNSTDSAKVEPKSGKEVGVWFNDESCWAYKGTLPVVIQFEKPSPDHMESMLDYVLSGCPSCQRLVISAGRKVKRWIILPP